MTDPHGPADRVQQLAVLVTPELVVVVALLVLDAQTSANVLNYARHTHARQLFSIDLFCFAIAETIKQQ